MTLKEAIKIIETEPTSKWPIEACTLIDHENERLMKREFRKLPMKFRLQFANIAFDSWARQGYEDCTYPFQRAHHKIPRCDR